MLCGFNDDTDFSLEVYDDVSGVNWLSALRRSLLPQSSGSGHSKDCQDIIIQHIFVDESTHFLLTLNFLVFLKRVL